MNMFDYEILVSIDPGANGGIVVYKDGKIINTIKMSKKGKIDYEGIREYFEHLKTLSDKILIGMEKVSSRPQDAKDGKFIRLEKLFENRATLRQIIRDLKIDFISIPVPSWISTLNVRKIRSNETQAERKTRYKLKAQQIFPYIQSVNYNADALLMVEFLRIKLESDRNWFQSFPIEKPKKRIL